MMRVTDDHAFPVGKPQEHRGPAGRAAGLLSRHELHDRAVR